MEATLIKSQPTVWNGSQYKNKARRSNIDENKGGIESATLIAVLPEKDDYTAMGDEGLMHAVGEGRREALEALYDRYANGCYGLALKIVRDPSIAEDIVQEVFMKVWSRPSSYVPERGKFSGWLLTLVHNRSVDKLRRASAGALGNSLPIDMDNGSGVTLADTLRDSGPTPEEEAWREETGRLVRAALGHLPEAQRQAISLAYFSGLTQKEIADKLGEPLGTIKTRTRSGLQHLRRLLANQGLLGDAA